MAVKAGMVAAVAALALVPALAARAQTAAMQQTAQCVLGATRDTRSRYAIQMIRQACNDVAVHTGPLYDRQRAYDQCLIQNLSGAQSDAAAVQIQGACRTTNPLL